MTGRVTWGYGCPPRKGTKARALLLMALRPQGFTAWEVYETLGYNRGGSLGAAITGLIDQKGYDIRGFHLRRDQYTEERFGPKVAPGRKTRDPLVYRLVGKHRWNGSYRSFVKLD